MRDTTSFVYLLLNPLDYYIPFYVGKGSYASRVAKNRPSFHLREALRGKKSAKCDLIREIIAANQTYSVLVWKDDLTEDEAYDLETELIIHFGRKYYDEDGILLNIVVNNRNIDYNKIVYRKGPDHHRYGISNSLEGIERQKATWRKRAQLEGLYSCKCGCNVEVSWDQRNRSANNRQKHGIADWHFKDLPHNQAKSRKIKLLLSGLKEEQISLEMYMDNQIFKSIINGAQR